MHILFHFGGITSSLQVVITVANRICQELATVEEVNGVPLDAQAADSITHALTTP